VWKRSAISGFAMRRFFSLESVSQDITGIFRCRRRNQELVVVGLDNLQDQSFLPRVRFGMQKASTVGSTFTIVLYKEQLSPEAAAPVLDTTRVTDSQLGWP
jgi:hypothetical protein